MCMKKCKVDSLDIKASWAMAVRLPSLAETENQDSMIVYLDKAQK